MGGARAPPAPPPGYATASESPKEFKWSTVIIQIKRKKRATTG